MQPSNPVAKIVTSQEESDSKQHHRILVALDYFVSTPDVLVAAIQLAQAFGSHLLIFHCLGERLAAMPEILTAASFTTYGGVYTKEVIAQEEKAQQRLIEEREVWLGHCRQQAEELGLRTESHYQFGETGTAICQFAQQWQADLIVVGRRGHTGLSEMLLGSVSNYVVHHAPCSVFIVQNSQIQNSPLSFNGSSDFDD